MERQRDRETIEEKIDRKIEKLERQKDREIEKLERKRQIDRKIERQGYIGIKRQDREKQKTQRQGGREEAEEERCRGTERYRDTEVERSKNRAIESTDMCHEHVMTHLVLE